MDPPFEVIEAGLAILAPQIMEAAARREAFWQVGRRYFAHFDLLLTPPPAVGPFALGVNYPKEIAGCPVGRRGWIRFTYPFNLTGQPAATVPWRPARQP